MVAAALRIITGALLGVAPRPAETMLALHPLHTTMAEVTFDPAHRTVRAMIRVFADDFSGAVARHAGGTHGTDGGAWDAAAAQYTTSAFALADRSGRAVDLHSCGVRRAGDLYFVCLEASGVNGLDALTVRSALLSEVYSDQINIVQADVHGTRKSLMFTRGDKAKPLG